MLLSPEEYLIFFTYLASCVVFYFGFSVSSLLNKTDSLLYPYTLKKESFLFGLKILVVHACYQYAFGNSPDIQNHPVDFIGTVLCAYLLALSVLNTSQQKGLPVNELLYASLAAGTCGYLMSYFFHLSSNIHSIHINVPTALFAFFVTCITSTLAMITIYWLRTYAGNHLNRLKVIFSVEIALGFLASHIAIDLSLIHQNVTQGINPGQYAPNYLTLLLVLTPILIFLTSFVLIIFYDKAIDVSQSTLYFRNTIVGSKKLFTHDPLTHLPNRDALNQHLILSAKRCDRSGESLALAYIDLDHFKPVNDNYGHHIGDLLLIEVSNRLGQAIRNCDYIARAGGDEFIAILGEISDHQSAVTVAQRIVDSLRQPFQIENHLIEISCSVGIAMYPKDGDLDKIKVNADAAMYKAKQSGKNQYRFFDTEIEQASDAMQQTRIQLKDAITLQQFKLLYQTKVNAITRHVHSAEALLRWEHPQRGLLSPAQFIEAAERFGMIEEINEWVITQACETISQAKQNGIDLSISVNLSNQQFRNKYLGQHIQSILETHKVDARNLILEVSETTAIHHQAQFRETLHQFRSLGLKVSLDDFGLHPFSLSYLQDMEISEVKLDRTLTKNVGHSPVALSIVEAVVKLAHALDLKVVAEGVEDEDQAIALTSAGCDQLQGYLFSMPVEKQYLFSVFSDLQLKGTTHSLF